MSLRDDLEPGAEELQLGREPRRPRRLGRRFTGRFGRVNQRFIQRFIQRFDRRAQLLTVIAVAVVVGALVVVLRPTGQPVPTTERPIVPPAPQFGAGAVQKIPRDPTACPARARCASAPSLLYDVEAVLRETFPSATYVGRLSQGDRDTGRVYLQRIQFTTGNLITVSIEQRALEVVPGGPPADLPAPDSRDVADGSCTLRVTRGGYVMTVSMAGLPGQVLPLASAERFLRIVPVP